MGAGAGNMHVSVTRADVEGYLNQLTYSMRNRVRRDVNLALQAFPKLQPGIGYFCDPQDGMSDVLCLKGSLPICFKGKRYGVPITVWILRRYPHDAPRIRINATAGMMIPSGRPDVDENGNLVIGFYYDWTPDSNISRLLGALVISFSSSPPIFSLDRPAVDTANTRPLPPFQQKIITACGIISKITYQNTETVLQHLTDVFSNYPRLHPGEGCPDSGNRETILHVKGTLNSGPSGDIPITMWVPRYYPAESPSVYMTSSSELSHGHVDTDGKVSIPYLEDWDMNNCTMTAILDVISTEIVSNSTGGTNSETTETNSLAPSAPDQNLCKICMDASMNVVFLLCKHLVCCEGCSENLTHCPICREPIVRKIVIFPT